MLPHFVESVALLLVDMLLYSKPKGGRSNSCGRPVASVCRCIPCLARLHHASSLSFVEGWDEGKIVVNIGAVI